LFATIGFGQSSSFITYMNPVIPGDHPDCTLTKVGNDYYTTGSSFNPTPVIYHSTDLVHWEAIAQPVSAAWSNYGDTPSGGCWGGQVVFHNNKYWDFFSRNNQMYFVSADDIRGTWTLPTLMSTPSIVPGLGYDNSIFIDDNGNWYLLVKNGQVNNWIVQLGDNGQPSGAVLNMCWINPSPSYPFSWAEGPVMWKYKGNYYYSFARNVAGGQIVFRSSKLTDSSSSWVNLGNFFNETDPLKSQALFQNPNHSSAAVMINDSTSWVVHPLWRNANNNEWYGQGRQGLLNQVHYDASGKPTADYPTNISKTAPKLPSGGIPWMVPHSDFFTAGKLNPEWSFLGYTAASSYSLTTRSGWLTLTPKNRSTANTIIKNDGEHNYAIITRLDFAAQSVNDQAGIQVFNGLQTLHAKLYSAIDSSGNKIVAFSYNTTYYHVNNPAKSGNNILLLKLVRVNHLLTGYFSLDGYTWTQIGSSINVADMENQQTNYNAWTGNRQGLYAQGSTAYFDYYIYRDAYTPILAECPANQYGTSVLINKTPPNSLTNIHNNDWALYAGVEFGNTEYVKKADSLSITASCASTGGVIEVWLDSLDAGTKIAVCNINSTGSWNTYKTFTTKVLQPVTGMHDVYLKFIGTGTDNLFMLQWITFVDYTIPTSVNDSRAGQIPEKFILEQNYPNPFNPTTQINYSVPWSSYIELKVYNLLGQEVKSLVKGFRQRGNYTVTFDSRGLSSGVYLYRMTAGSFMDTKKTMLLK
jgi:beta-xylosidase